MIDCPGFQDFAGEVAAALRAVEAGIIFCTAKDGLSVGAERNWKLLKAAGKPVAFYVSKLDEEHGDYFGVLEALQAKYGSIVCPVTIPASDGTGVIDLVHNIAYETNGNKTAKVAVPAADAGKAEELREALMETAAGATEELMEKYFEEMTLSEEELVTGIKAGLKDRSVVPVFCGVGYDRASARRLCCRPFWTMSPRPTRSRASIPTVRPPVSCSRPCPTSSASTTSSSSSAAS